MSTYTKRLHHIVFGTKDRVPALVPEHRRLLFGYMHGIIKGLKCHLLRLNGVEDHLHLLVDLHSDVSLSTFVRTLKTSSGEWIRRSGTFPDFRYWQGGYGAFAVSWSDRDRVIEYIKNQEPHHRRESYLDEFRRLVEEAGLEWDGRFPPG
jgi:putative transposase